MNTPFASLLVLVCSGTLAMGQVGPIKPVPKVARASEAAVSLKLSGSVRLRPQEVDQALSAAGTTVLLDDESVRVSVVANFASMADRNSFSGSFPVMVLQKRASASGAWEDVSTIYKNSAVKPVKGAAAEPRATTPVENVKIDPRVRPGAGSDPNITVPQDPHQPPRPKTGQPFDQPATTVPGLSFDSSALTLPVGTVAIRASARRTDGTSVESGEVRLDVRKAPPVLTLLAMGGTCTDPDANTTWKNLEEAGITRDVDGCASKGVPAAFMGDLTPMSSVNCNDPGSTGCTNFMKHLGLSIMNDKNLANEMENINDPGTERVDRRVNAGGVRNRVIFGKWRNTEEELVCGTPIKFDQIIDDFVGQGGKSLILIGQSQGGAKFAGMVRDHWRWGSKLTLELIVLWDATSFDVPNGFDTGHLGVVSMGVRKVGDKPKKVLSFCQYSNAVPFQNGSPLDPTEHHADLEEHDLDGCFSHNGIARSQFVHHRTEDVVKDAVVAARDRARK